jgi:DNA-binding GntR family transcriptional regulator
MRDTSSDVEQSAQSLLDVVTAEIRRMILEAELSPGSHLPEGRLAEILGVSRNPVREAIRILSTEGFVDISPRRGAFVASLAPEDGERLFEVRLVLEPLGAKLAARHRTDAQLAGMRRVLDDAADDDIARVDLIRVNTRFHIAIFEASDNPYLAAIGTQTVQRSQWVLQMHAGSTAPQFRCQHEVILDAVAAGDEDLAEAEALRHVAAVRRGIRNAFQEGRA